MLRHGEKHGSQAHGGLVGGDLSVEVLVRVLFRVVFMFVAWGWRKAPHRVFRNRAAILALPHRRFRCRPGA